MAAVTLLGAATFNTNNGTKTVTATPAANDLIVIVCAHTGNTSAATPTDNQGGTYVGINSAQKASSADTLSAFIRTALIPAGTSTVFTHAPGTTSGGGLAVHKVTGMTRVGLDAVRQSNFQSNQAAGGTPTVALGQAMLTGNAGIGAAFNATSPATLTPRTNWQERADVGYSTPTTGLETMSRDSGETASSIAWGGTSASAFCSLVIELDTTAAPQSLTPSLYTNTQTFYAPTIVPGAVTLAPSLVTNTQTFFASEITQPSQSQTLEPGLFANAQVFYAPTVSPGAVTLAAPLLTNTQAFYGQTVSPGAVTLTPALLTNEQVFYASTLTSAAQVLGVPLLVNTSSFFSITVVLRRRPKGRDYRENRYKHMTRRR